MEKRQKKIIVPVDFSQDSLRAADLASQFARLHGSELVLLYVVEPVSALVEFFAEKNINEKRRNAAIEKLDQLVEKYNKINVRTAKVVAEGKVYKEVLRVSEELLAEMIVIGVHGQDHQDPDFLGSNVNKIIRGTNCPVLTASAEVENLKINKILIPVDPEFGIRELRAHLQEYKDVFNPAVHLVTVDLGQMERKELEAYMQKQKETLHKQGIEDVSWKIAERELVSKVIVDEANGSHYDMVWMETHGRKGLSGFLMSSVTEEVICYSKVPVLSLKPLRKESHPLYYHSNFPI